MGFADMFYGRSAKARERRAAKISAKYAEFEQMTPDLLEVLARAADVPTTAQVTLYVQAVPSGATPRRVLHGFRLSDATSYAAVLFDDWLSIRWGAYPRLRDKELKVQGAELPFWGMQKIETFNHEADDGILVSGNDGKNEYRIGFLGHDPEDVRAFAEDAANARQVYIQRAHQAQATRPAPEDAAQMRVNIDSSLPPEQQLAALEQLRAVGGVPDDVYRAAAAKIRSAHS